VTLIKIKIKEVKVKHHHLPRLVEYNKT